MQGQRIDVDVLSLDDEGSLRSPVEHTDIQISCSYCLRSVQWTPESDGSALRT